MNFWAIICAVALNVSTGWLLKPYGGGMTRVYVSAAKYFSNKKYKTGVICGAIFAALGFLLIWVVVDHVVMILEYQSAIYSYIAYGIIIYFCAGCGQVAGIIRKFSGNTENDTYIKQLFGYMLVPNANKIERLQYKKVFIKASTRLIAEKIVTPFILLIFLGTGATAAYAFINHFARSDGHTDVISHGYAAAAIKINSVVSWIGYAVLSLLLWAIKWIFNLKFSFKGKKYREKCERQLYEIAGDKEFSEDCVKSVKFTVYASAIMLFLLLTAVYIFIQALLAAFGLDEYWNFWNGTGID